MNLILKNVNVFIGPQAAGKSVIAKIYTIFKSPRKFLKETSNDNLNAAHKYSKETIEDILKLFNIDTFLTLSTEISFESEVHKISLMNGEIAYESKLLNKIKQIKILAEDFQKDKVEICQKLSSLFPNFLLFHIRATRYLKDNKILPDKPRLASLEDIKKLDENDINELIKIVEENEIALSTNAAVYIPAERSIANIIKQSLANLLLNEVPIPKHILSFAAELEKSKRKSIDLGFIQSNLKYQIENGIEKIYIKEGVSISLDAAASGIQSVIPILSFADKMGSTDHKSFVIEEPELNLFPIAQYKLLQLIECIRHDPSMYDWEDIGIIHTYTTHSPYILSALNNFLYAHKVAQELSKMYRTPTNFEERRKLERDMTVKVKTIVKAVIAPNSFTAYQIKDGLATSIFDEKVGLISDNFIDESTDAINDDFDKLMELMNESATQSN